MPFITFFEFHYAKLDGTSDGIFLKYAVLEAVSFYYVTIANSLAYLY